MRQNKCFILKEIENIPYLLPYGQMIADRKRGIQINDSGVYIWKLLEKDRTMNELVVRCAEYYEVAPEDLPEFQNDISHFVQQLIAFEIVIDEPDVDATGNSQKLSIYYIYGY